MIETQLKDILEKTFDCQKLEIKNQSHLHAGHMGDDGSGQTHFKVVIVSSDFEGKTRVQRHQMINNAVNHLFSNGLHALSLDLKSPLD